MTANNLLMQFLADVLDVPVVRPIVAETPSLGAAYAAGLAVGFWPDIETLRAHWHKAAEWLPDMDPAVREKGYRKWRKAVAAHAGLGRRRRLSARRAPSVTPAAAAAAARAAGATTSRPGPGGRRCAGRGSSRGPCAPRAGSSPPSPPRAASAERASASPSVGAVRLGRAAAPRPRAAARRASSCRRARALPRDCTPLTPASSAAVQPARSSASRPGRRRAHLQEQRPVERAGGAADARHERHADRLQQRADVVALDRVELLDHLAHPAVHVRPVVAVADRRVELDQLGPVLGDRGGEGARSRRARRWR